MSAVDGMDIFGSGPHAFVPGPWERSLDRRGFSGVDGELVLDQGLRSRVITQTGRLTAGSAEDMAAIRTQIESFADGRLHMLEDNHGQTYARVILEAFEAQTPIRLGRGFWCDYIVRYRQLP